MMLDFEPGDTLDMTMSSGKEVVRNIRGVVLSMTDSRFSVLTENGIEIPFRKDTAKVGSMVYTVLGLSEVPLSLSSIDKGLEE